MLVIRILIRIMDNPRSRIRMLWIREKRIMVVKSSLALQWRMLQTCCHCWKLFPPPVLLPHWLQCPNSNVLRFPYLFTLTLESWSFSIYVTCICGNIWHIPLIYVCVKDPLLVASNLGMQEKWHCFKYFLVNVGSFVKLIGKRSFFFKMVIQYLINYSLVDWYQYAFFLINY